MGDVNIDDTLLFFQIPHQFIHALVSSHAMPTGIGLNKTEVRTLMILRDSGSTSMQNLGKLVGMSKGSFTHVIDKLICSGLAVRSENPEDRRMILVSMTEKGLKTACVLDKNLRSHLDQKLKCLKNEERLELMSALKSIRKITVLLNEDKNENR